MDGQSRFRQLLLLGSVCCGLIPVSRAFGEIRYIEGVDSLLERADVVVVARPVGIKEGRLLSKRFLVEEVLRGDPDLKSQPIHVDLQDWECRHAGPGMLKKGERVRRALLFLQPPNRKNGYRYKPLYCGVRFLQTDNGHVLVPWQSTTFGPDRFALDKSVNWHILLTDLRGRMPLKNLIYSFRIGGERARPWVELLPSHERRTFAFKIPAWTPTWIPRSTISIFNLGVGLER